MDINCPHFTLCSGCTINFDVNRFGTYQEAVSYFKTRDIKDFPLHTGSPVHWRCRAKLAVRGGINFPLVGLYEKGSHRVVDIPQCKVHHPLINEAAALLRRWIKEYSIAPYDELSGNGVLRYLQFGVDRINNKVQLSLIVNLDEAKSATLNVALEALYNIRPDLWHSIWLNFNERRDNVIVGSSWKLHFGEEWLWESYRGKLIATHPASFVQANPEMFERLLGELDGYVPLGSSVAEFYAGGGVIGLTVLDRCISVECNEVVPLAETCFKESCLWLSSGQREKIRFVSGAAEKHVDSLLIGADVAIVDPPRKGLDPRLLKAFNAHQDLGRLIYVSCGWESFCRDCDALLKQGWKLTNASGYLFFPGTDHLEVLAVFNRHFTN